MIKRTIEISSPGHDLRVRNDQLEIRKRVGNEEQVSQVPCEDIGLLLVDHRDTTFSHTTMVRLAEYGAAVVFCGENHLPVSLSLPLPSHCEGLWRLESQLQANKPLRKRLWQQLVKEKVINQAHNLKKGSETHSRLVHLASRVRSGDPDNIEAQAARAYWREWAGEEASFRRDPDGTDALNSMLNYGYSVFRASLGRAIVCAGLLPAIGLHHANRSNSFCLADDLLEPMRPWVDARVRSLYRSGVDELDREAKAGLLSLLAETVQMGDSAGPVMVSMHHFVASLVRCLQGSDKQLQIPVWTETN